MKQNIPFSKATAENAAHFTRLSADAFLLPHAGDCGIGTLGEKRLHATIKRFLCEDTSCHEVGILDTRYVADVCIGNKIYEVQTGPMAPLFKKLAHYLQNTDHNITVVHPIPYVRKLSWVDPATGEFTPPRRVGGRETVADLLPKLYPLIPLLQNERLSFCCLVLEVLDLRLLSKNEKRKKIDAVKLERLPLSLLGGAEFSSPADFAVFLPPDLPEIFTVKEFSALTGYRGRDAYSAVRVLAALGLLKEAPPQGKTMQFEQAK